MKKVVVIIAIISAAFASQAQTPVKMGYADIEYIISQMPEAKQIDAELKSTQTQLRNQLDTKAKEFQTKLADYQANQGTMLEAVRANTERELQMLQSNLEKLQQDAQTTIQNKQTQLLQPVYDKVEKAIAEVAKENGFTFILSNQIGGLNVVLYADEKAEVSDLVLKKLGVTPKPQTSQPTGTTPKK
jgi:outer membrane protein